MAEFAGGYIKAFATKVVVAAERFLGSWTSDCYAATSQDREEETFMEVENEVPYDATHGGTAEKHEPNQLQGEVKSDVIKAVAKIPSTLGTSDKGAQNFWSSKGDN